MASEPPAPGGADSLGAGVVASDVYAAQRRFVRKPPAPATVAAVIDALAEADQTLSLAAVAAVAGRAARRPEGFAATLERLLNVESYEVLSLEDGGHTLRLNVSMLRTQFGLEAG